MIFPNAVNAQQIGAYTDEIARLMQGLVREDRWGGVLLVATSNGSVLYRTVLCLDERITSIDDIDLGRLVLFGHHALDKLSRLVENQDHISAWQSRKDLHYGGAVRSQSGLIYSFSGFCEHMDEIAAAAFATLLEGDQSERWLEVARISDNGALRTFAQDE